MAQDQTLKLLITADGKGLSAGLQRAAGELQKFGTTAGRIFAGVSKAFAAVGVTLSAGSLVAGLKTITGTFDDLAKSSQKVGLTVEELSKLKYAADLSGLSFEQLETGLKQFSRNLTEGRQGSKELQTVLNQLGISAKLTNEQALLKIADTFQKLPDGAEKTAIAMRLFGRAGADLVPLLNQGSEGIRTLYQEAERLGIVVSTDAAKAAEEFNDNMSRVGSTLTAVGYAIGNAILPYLSDLADGMAEAAKEGKGLVGVLGALVQRGLDLVIYGPGEEGAYSKLLAQEELLRDARLKLLEIEKQRADLPTLTPTPEFDAAYDAQRAVVSDLEQGVDKLKGRVLELQVAQEKAGQSTGGVIDGLNAAKDQAYETATAISNLQNRYKKLVDSIKEGKAEVAAGPIKDVKQSSVLDINRLRDQARTFLDRGDVEGAKAAERLIKRAQEINDYLLETGKISKGYYQSQADKLLELATSGQQILDENPVVLPVQVDSTGVADGIATELQLQQKFLDQNPLVIRTVLDNAELPPPGITMPALATGGLISGPGTPTSDSILARLSAGEFVVRASAVRNYGLGFLERLNSLALPRFAQGGMATAGTPVILNLPGGQSFGLSAQPSVAKQLASILSTEVLKRGRR